MTSDFFIHTVKYNVYTQIYVLKLLTHISLSLDNSKYHKHSEKEIYIAFLWHQSVHICFQPQKLDKIGLFMLSWNKAALNNANVTKFYSIA